MNFQGLSLATPSALVYEVQEILDEIDITEWVKPFDEWEVRVRRCIRSGGGYLENEFVKL
jgi:hypothetical protein